ncbi:MAG: sugar ABC transporter ATP-binding protein [Planctomycetes bacterium]|nr:sugar ABC transporter ATP-binding protein [Planctomycetota bacterium]
MRGVRKEFGPTLALDGVDFEVRAGEVHALLGENGAGKSTLMKVLAGALAPDAGTITLDGLPFAPSGPVDARRAGVGLVHQELALAPQLSVAENVMLGVEPMRSGLAGRLGLIDRSALRRRAREALATVGRAELPLEVPVGRLRLADRQLVEIARCMTIGARVVVFDEPTSSLTQSDTERLFALIRRLRDEGVAVVYISHFLEELRAIADRCTVLRDGRSVGTFAMAAVRDDELVARMVGRGVADLYPRSPRRPGELLLEVDELAGERLPGRASLTLRRGEVLGIAGLVGAGRTELLRAIFGLDAIRRGTLRVGARSGPCPPAVRWRERAGFVSEDRKREGLALGLSIDENVALPRLPARPTTRALAATAGDAVVMLRVKCARGTQRVGELSGGNQQKVALARLMHADCDVLLLDEPTRGIDVAARADVYRWIDALASGADGRQPRAILFVSSYLPELLGVCDRIAVMRLGVLGPARDVTDLDEHKLLREALP